MNRGGQDEAKGGSWTRCAAPRAETMRRAVRGGVEENKWRGSLANSSVGDLYLHTKHAVSQAFVSEIRVARETTQCLSATLGARASWAMYSARDDASGMRVVRALLRGDAARVRASEVSERARSGRARSHGCWQVERRRLWFVIDLLFSVLWAACSAASRAFRPLMVPSAGWDRGDASEVR